MSVEIKVGADPEIWAAKNGKIVSAHGLLKGTKSKPFKVNKGAVQIDGMALEFNIDPASSEDEFCINIEQVLHQMKLMIPQHEIVVQPVAHFDQSYMKQQPREALELGCTPDYNGWTGAANPKPDGERTFRTASGHVHIGWTDSENVQDGDHINNCHMAARQMDFYLGLGSLCYDADTQRREMYGKAGCCRIKPYGVEYRTLSNAWLKSEKLMRWVYRNAVRGMQDLINGIDLSKKYGDIQHIINNSDLKAANSIIKAEKLEVCYA